MALTADALAAAQLGPNRDRSRRRIACAEAVEKALRARGLDVQVWIVPGGWPSVVVRLPDFPEHLLFCLRPRATRARNLVLDGPIEALLEPWYPVARTRRGIPGNPRGKDDCQRIAYWFWWRELYRMELVPEPPPESFNDVILPSEEP